MRLGTTSYIYPANIVPNVRKLVGRVDDIELLIFELDDDLSNLPDEETVSELQRLGSAHGMTYTVHLPIDLRLADDESSWSVQKAIRVIRSTRELSPYGYIIHLEDRHGPGNQDQDRWIENSARSLEALAKESGSLEDLCVENLESYPPETLDGILQRIPVSCCVDVGHLWKDGLDPIGYLERWLPRARVVHIHGIGQRDHMALSLASAKDLDPVVTLLERCFRGVLTFEVFNEEHLLDSLDAFEQSVNRVKSTFS